MLGDYTVVPTDSFVANYQFPQSMFMTSTVCHSVTHESVTMADPILVQCLILSKDSCLTWAASTILLLQIVGGTTASLTIGAFACSASSRRKCISVAKSAKLLRSSTKKCDLKNHLSLSIAICDRKHASRIP